MASPLIGCKEQELIYINTEKFDLIIKGKPCHPKFEALNKSDSVSNLSVMCKSLYSIEVALFPDCKAERDNGIAQLINYKTIPLFFEHQNYEFIIENKGDFDIFFWHENRLIREKVGIVGRSKKTLAGVVNFGSEIGFSEFKIYADGESFLEVCIEVFPSKIDYSSDYIAILNDVNSEIYNLAFDFLKKTYLWSNIKENVGDSLTEFFSIIDIIFDKFKAATDTVLKTPHHILQHENQVVPFHKLKKTNAATLRWLERNPQNLLKLDDRYVPQRALTVKKSISFDTFENRFIKYILKTITKKLDGVKHNYLRLGRKTDDHIIKRLDFMKQEIAKKIEFSFLKDVGDLHTVNTLSLVLNMAPGYKDLYKYYLMLIKGLSLDGEVFKISIKDLSILYEYWCFIKLNSLLKNKYKLIKQDLIKVDNTGLFVTLSKGKKAEVTYENPQNGERFTISYNPLIRELPTVSQKPDNILSLEKHKSKVKYEYIFDAKYRINPALEGTSYMNTYGQPGPEEDDINTMHRYRDAIVQDASQRPDFERTMFGAYVLFPYNNEELFQNHRFYESLDKVNVGGLPFLPSATNLVEQLLSELIDDSPESAFERTVLPKGSYDYINNIDFDNCNVLVGDLSKAEQLTINLGHNFYHIPCNKIADNRLPLRYIAIYQSNNIFKKDAGIKYYGEILSCEKVKRGDITEIPTSRDASALYYRFNIKEWKALDNRIKPKELGIRTHIYTNMFLLQNAEYVPELCIKSKEEYRLHMELKRLANEVDIKARIMDNDDSMNSFVFENCRISMEENVIKVFRNQSHREFKLDSFKSKPRTTMMLIKKFIHEK